MRVGHELSSSSKLQYAIVDNLNPPPRHNEGRRVIIVDTPGSDTNEDCAKILRRISDWLASS